MANIEKPKTNLSPVAQEVAPYLQKIHEELREEINNVTRQSLIDLANDIIRREMEGEDVSGLKVDFRLGLANAKSLLLIKEEEKRGKTIIANYTGKLDRGIAG